MANAATSGAGASAARPGFRLSPALIAVLAVIAWVAARLLFQGEALTTSLGDTDDATRLVQLHAWLSHGRWFDMTMQRIGAPEPLVSHWSRLIDLGLAAIYQPLAPFVGQERAELAMRIVWPALTLMALTVIVVREAVHRAGPTAGYIATGFMLMSTTAVYQFQPGRIDHHNVQILCAVGGVLLLARAMDAPRVGWSAGIVLGLGLGVGLEGMSLTVPALALAVLIGLGRPDGLAGTSRAALAFAVSVTFSVALSNAPDRIAVAVCDAASINLIALGAFSAAGVAIADRLSRLVTGRVGLALQLAALSLAGIAGVAAYAVLNPACLGGPFGEVPASLWPIWLSQVTEGQPISYLLRTSPGETAAFLAIVGAALVACAIEILSPQSTGAQINARSQAIFLFAVQTTAILASTVMIKMMPYAIWLALPGLAVAVTRLPAVGGLSPLVTRAAAFALLGQSTLAALLGPPILALPRSATLSDGPARTACSDTATISALRVLPTGLILADLNAGPYIAALTDHRVVSAPYHRLGTSIVAGQGALNGSPMAAEQVIRKLGTTYVVACAASLQMSKATQPMALEDALSVGIPPSYLEPLPLNGASKLLVYRLKSPN